MGTFVKKARLSIITGEYVKDGQTKKQYRQIGELITMLDDNGQEYQFGVTWGPQGEQKFNLLYDEENQQQQPQQGYQQQGQPPNNGYQR